MLKKLGHLDLSKLKCQVGHGNQILKQPHHPNVILMDCLQVGFILMNPICKKQVKLKVLDQVVTKDSLSRVLDQVVTKGALLRVLDQVVVK